MSQARQQALAIGIIVRVFFVLVFSVVVAHGALRMGFGRQLLWRAIQGCALDHRLLHAAFPCIEVKAEQGRNSGFALLRSPFDKSHVILSPTIRIIGIETTLLHLADAPHFLEIAWSKRRLAYPKNYSAVPDADMGLAINSRRGRTQDQFHVHIDCLLGDVIAKVNALALPPKGQWLLTRLDDGTPYSITSLEGDLSGSNAIDLAARHLNLSRDTMPSLTIAVVTRYAGPGGNLRFVLMAREDHGREHAELLLDHDCRRYRVRMGG